MSDNLPQTIGIDISKASLDCHAYPAGDECRFANTAKGHKALIAWLRQWQVERIAYEATGTYHRALEVALAEWPGTVRNFVCGEAVDHQAVMALMKRSPKRTAN